MLWKEGDEDNKDWSDKWACLVTLGTKHLKSVGGNAVNVISWHYLATYESDLLTTDMETYTNIHSTGTLKTCNQDICCQGTNFVNTWKTHL